MAKSLSVQELKRWADKARGMNEKLANVKAKGQKHAMEFARTATVSTVAFGAGMAQGYFGPVEVGGVSAELALGVGSKVAGFLGLGGKMGSTIVHAAGDGFLAVHFATVGRGQGKKMALKNGKAAARDAAEQAQAEAKAANAQGALPPGSPMRGAFQVSGVDDAVVENPENTPEPARVPAKEVARAAKNLKR